MYTSELHTTDSETRCWIQRPGITLALLLIVLAFLTMVQQWRGPKMQPHHVQQAPAHITTPTGNILNAHNVFAYTAVVLSTVLTNENFQFAIYKYRVFILLLCKYTTVCDNCIILHFNASSIALAIL